VIGKANRLKLEARGRSYNSGPKRPRIRPKLVKLGKAVNERRQQTPFRRLFYGATGPALPPAPLPEAPQTDIGRVHIADLESKHCRWIVGEPADGMCCGEDRVPGLPYCKPHSLRAYLPPQPRHRPQTEIITYTIEKIEELQPA